MGGAFFGQGDFLFSMGYGESGAGQLIFGLLIVNLTNDIGFNRLVGATAFALRSFEFYFG